MLDSPNFDPHEYVRAAEARAGDENGGGDGQAAARGPLPLSEGSVAHMVREPAPEIPWLIQDRLPLGIVGILAAAGASGKSFTVLQLAIALATRGLWLGLPTARKCSTVIFSAEDDHAEAHRRIQAILSRFEAAGPDVHEAAANDVAERVFVFDRVGSDNRITTPETTGRAPFVDQIIATVQQVKNLGLVVLDPLSRFDGGDPNDNAHGTRLIEVAETIRKETGATVLIPHHLNKSSAKDDTAGQEAVRGASALVDGARLVWLMQPLRSDQANTYGVHPEHASFYVKFSQVKANACPPWEGVWLKRQPGGVLEPTTLKPRKDEAEQRGEDRYNSVLPRMKEVVRDHQHRGTPITRRGLREYAGTAGKFGVGDQSLRAIIQRALEEGELTEQTSEDGRRTEIRTW